MSKKVQYTPYITVNGKFDSSAQTRISLNMLKYVCENYDGEVEIAGCKDEDRLNKVHFDQREHMNRSKTCKSDN